MTGAEILLIIKIIQLVTEVGAPIAIKAINELQTDDPTWQDFEALRLKVRRMTLEDFR